MGLLQGIRVVDFSNHGPGARAARVLADYGAEVIRITRPAHRRAGEIDTPRSAYGGGQGFMPVAIDLQHPEGQALAVRVTATADVVIEAFRPGVADRLGIGYDAVRAANPRVVYCAISGYGQRGARSQWVGHDLNYQAVAGLLDRSQRRSDGGPPVPGATIADGAGGGLHAVVAVLAALVARDRSGAGRYLDVATTDGALWLMAVQIEQHQSAGLGVGPIRLLSGDFGCYRTYECRDGKWLSVAALEHRFWRNLCVALDLEELVTDHEVDDRQPAVIAALEATFATRDRDDWVAALASRETCVAPVLGVEEIVNDAAFSERGLVGERWLAPLLAGSQRDDRGVDQASLFAELGLDAERREHLQAAGVIEVQTP